MLGEAKAIGAFAALGFEETDAEIEGMILVDLRTEVGSKKTAPRTVSLVVGDGMGCIIPGFLCPMQCETISVIVDFFRLPSIATRFGLY